MSMEVNEANIGEQGGTLAHNHSLDIEPFGSHAAGSHSHSVDLPLHTQGKTTTTAQNLPPYYGLLKIMRIK